MLKTHLAVVYFALALTAASRIDAANYAETGTAYDSHDLSGNPSAPNPELAFFPNSTTAQPLGMLTGTLLVSGTTGTSESDFYKIDITDPANFSASTLSLAGGRNGFDTQLFLFNLNGTGIAANDDYNSQTTSSPDSLLPAGNSLYSGLTPGFYLLEISGGGKYGQDAAGTILFPNQDEGSDPTLVYGPKAGETAQPIRGYNGISDQGGTYGIALTGVALSVPEPSSWAAIIFLTAVVGGLRSWFRRSDRRGATAAV